MRAYSPLRCSDLDPPLVVSRVDAPLPRVFTSTTQFLSLHYRKYRWPKKQKMCIKNARIPVSSLPFPVFSIVKRQLFRDIPQSTSLPNRTVCMFMKKEPSTAIFRSFFVYFCAILRGCAGQDTKIPPPYKDAPN